MRSINNIYDVSIGRSLSSDELIEFHASRLLLLLLICGINDKGRRLKKIEGFTKLAKLDFFIRYPEFFVKAAESLGSNEKIFDSTIESKMIRFHYGPWDKRYYEVLPYLEAKGLIEIRKISNTYLFYLTEKGSETANELKELTSFSLLVSRIESVNKVFGKMPGTRIKDLIYKLFDEEVGQKKLNELI